MPYSPSITKASGKRKSSALKCANCGWILHSTSPGWYTCLSCGGACTGMYSMSGSEQCNCQEKPPRPPREDWEYEGDAYRWRAA